MLSPMADAGTPTRWATVREVVADRQVARLLAVVASWAATENAFLLAASVLALDLGGPAGVGLAGAMRVLPAAVSATFVAGLADRVQRALVIAVVGAGSVLSSLVKPSMQALLPLAPPVADGPRLGSQVISTMVGEVGRAGLVGLWPGDVAVPSGVGVVVRPLTEERLAPLQVATHAGWGPADDLVAAAVASVRAVADLVALTPARPTDRQN